MVIPLDSANLDEHGFSQGSTDFACVRLRILLKVLVMADETAKLILTCEAAGRIGGFTRARKLTPEQRRESARRAAQARWAKKADAPDPTDPQGPQRDEGQGPGIMLTSRRPAASATSGYLSGRSHAAAA